MKLEAVKKINNSTITPKVLLNKFINGNRPAYKHNNDILLNELKIIAEQYKSTFNLDKKVELLTKERDILYQELEQPELTLARNYNAIRDFFGKKIKGDEILDILRLFSITGINRNEKLKGPFFHKSPESRLDVLEKAYLEFSESTNAGLRGKDYVLEVLKTLETRNPEFKEKILCIYDKLLKNTEYEGLKDKILAASEKFDKDKIFSSLKEEPIQANKLSILLLKSKDNDKEIAKFINEILQNQNIDSECQELAIWGAGKHKSNENFNLIKNIALNENEPNIRKREFAIHSVALYLKHKPEEVKEIISKIKNENSQFSSLGTVLYDKITGNYHGKKNRELHYLKYSDEEIENFRKNINKFYEPEKTLNTQQENACHRATAYLNNNILEKIISNGNKYYLQDDTFTKLNPLLTGKRYINKGAGIYNSGDFYDAFDGICTQNYNMMNLYRVSNSEHTNVLAHENAHTLNNFFDTKDSLKLHQLYENAMNKEIFLDSYAAANPREYFAQGTMAYATAYLPHKELIGSYDHTRYELLFKDPELYNFVDYILKKYN